MFPVIDMHCDTMSRILNFADKGTVIDIRNNDMHIDLERMKQAGYMCQCFAMFTQLGRFGAKGGRPRPKDEVEKYSSALEYVLALSDTWDRCIAENSDIIRPVLTATEIEKNWAEGYMSALKTVEEGGVYLGSVDNLKLLYDKGARMSTLTWNFENELAYPNRMHVEGGPVPETELGLKPAGEDMIRAMEEMGVIIDVSHLGDAGIWAILNMTKKETPIIASHSNARTVCGHVRNVTDEMLKTIADKGGVCGINFSSDFLSDRGDNYTTVADMIEHIKYMKKVAGIDVVGLGTDFDGIGSKLEIDGCGQMQKLADGMSAAGFTTEEIEKVFYKNVLRVMKTVLG